MAGEVALEQAGGVAAALAFGDAAGDVVLGGGVVLAAVEDDGVEGAVELAVAAAAEAVADRLTARGGDGATPARRAKAASERTRPWCDQVTISWAATIGPTPGSSSSCGASARTCPRISRSSSSASCGRGLDPLRERAQHEPIVASSSGVRELERRKRLQRSSSSPTGSRRSSSRSRRGRSRSRRGAARARLGGRRRRCDARAAAAAAPLGAAPPRQCAASRWRAPREPRGSRRAESSLPRSRRSARGVRPTLEHGLAAAAEIAREAGAVVAGALDRPDTRAAARAPQRSAAPPHSRARSPAPIAARPQPPSARQRPQHVLVAVRVDTNRRSPARLQASRLILRLTRRVRCAGLDAGKPRRQDCDESRQQGGQAPDQANSGRQTGAAVHTRTIHSQGTHNAACHLTSHTRHGRHQAGNGPRQTDPPSLTDA